MGDDQQQATWVAGIIAGDTGAFDAAYAHYRPRIFSFLVRLGKHRPLAEDLLQETFIRLARHGPRLRPDTQLAAWLYRVARNLYIGHRRWELLDASRLAEARMFAKLRGPEVTPFALHAANEAQLRLEAALSALPLHYREVVLVVLVEGFDHEQAAEVLGIQRAALRQRLKRARAMLKAALEP